MPLTDWTRIGPNEPIKCPKCRKPFDRAGPRTVVEVRLLPTMQELILPASTIDTCGRCGTRFEKLSRAA